MVASTPLSCMCMCIAHDNRAHVQLLIPSYHDMQVSMPLSKCVCGMHVHEHEHAYVICEYEWNSIESEDDAHAHLPRHVDTEYETQQN